MIPPSAQSPLHSRSLVRRPLSFRGGAGELNFITTGTAVYIYFILSNYPASSGLFSDVKCDFAIDGKLAGSYSHISDGTKVFQYNTLVFSKTGLSNGPHTFVILPADNGPLGNYIIFDYARYTCVSVTFSFLFLSLIVSLLTERTLLSLAPLYSSPHSPRRPISRLRRSLLL